MILLRRLSFLTIRRILTALVSYGYAAGYLGENLPLALLREEDPGKPSLSVPFSESVLDLTPPGVDRPLLT